MNIREQKRIRKETVHNPDRKIEFIGFDTETYLGKCKLLCDSEGDYWDEYSNITLFDFLTKKNYRGKFLFFFNIRFDFQSIIKHLPENLVFELYFTGSTFYKDKQKEYSIFYINQKMFKICAGHKSFIFYDLANFLEGSLDNLAFHYLKERKIETVDSTKLNEDIDYWNINYEEIKKYCLKDALLTKKLCKIFWNDIRENLKFIPYKPYSKGSISQEYFLHKLYIPTINYFLQSERLQDILRHAYNSYSGGRFELLKRGFIKNVYLYDIKSAYPYEIANLIDYTKGKWYESLYFDDFLYGFWKCKIEFYNDTISPFMQKMYDLNIYPNGKFRQYLTKNEIEFILNNFKSVEITPISGYGFVPLNKEGITYKPKYPFEYIEYLYKLKEESIEESRRNAYKIIMNSLYGKFIQTIGGHTGKLFNPLWAAEITANTRIKLLKLALKNNNLKHIISISTDSIFIDKEIKDSYIGNNMGQWELKFKGEYGVFLMSDVYSIHTKEGDKHKLRGYKIQLKKDDPETEWITAFNIVNHLNKDMTFTYKIKRPMNLGECIIQSKTKNLGMLNIWKEDLKKVNINGDLKRIWEDNFRNGKEPQEICHSSIPILI